MNYLQEKNLKKYFQMFYYSQIKSIRNIKQLLLKFPKELYLPFEAHIMAILNCLGLYYFVATKHSQVVSHNLGLNFDKIIIS